MIKYEDGVIEVEAQSVSEVMQEASMLIMAVVRQVKEVLPDDVPADFLVQDLFKSLRYAALTEDGKSEEEALAILAGEEPEEKLILE
jgi:hypothetical protein